MSIAIAPVDAAVEVYDGPGRPRTRQIDWPQIAAASPVLAGTMQRYLAQIALSFGADDVDASRSRHVRLVIFRLNRHAFARRDRPGYRQQAQ